MTSKGINALFMRVCVHAQRPELTWWGGGLAEQPGGSSGAVSRQEASCLSTSTSLWSKTRLTAKTEVV